MGYRNDKPSMFDDMPDQVRGAVIQEVSEQLFDSWIGTHLDEVLFIADYEMALMSSDPAVKKMFNEYWEVDKNEGYYLDSRHVGEDDKMNNPYISCECDKCGVEILVRENDNSTRCYCHPCAMTKLGEVP